jgi:hypothetical protein
MSDPSDAEFQTGLQQLSTREILNPEKSVKGLVPSPDSLCIGEEGIGIKSTLEKTANDAVSKIISEVDADQDLRERFVSRYQLLIGVLGQEVRKKGVEEPRFNDNDRVDLAALAHELETKGVDYSERVSRIASEKFADDPEKAKLVSQRMIDNLVSAEQDLFDHIATRIQQRRIEKTTEKRSFGDKEKAKWRQVGESWSSQSPDGRKAILDQIAGNHEGSVAKVVRFEQQPGHVYFFLNPNNPAAKESHKNLMRGVNRAQDSLVDRITEVGKDKPVTSIPTQSLRGAFNELDILGREAKIHIQPKVEEEPWVVDRLLSTLDAQPELGDVIDAVKVRVVGNGEPELDGSHIPEIVIYTDQDSRDQVLTPLMKEFLDLEGNGLTPRFNREVTGNLLYVAQSGGDLKERLQHMGLLDKFFDAESNHSELRV